MLARVCFVSRGNILINLIDGADWFVERIDQFNRCELISRKGEKLTTSFDRKTELFVNKDDYFITEAPHYYERHPFKIGDAYTRDGPEFKRSKNYIVFSTKDKNKYGYIGAFPNTEKIRLGGIYFSNFFSENDVTTNSCLDNEFTTINKKFILTYRRWPKS